MKSRQSGFTLIELIVVIVILGILAATALPKFINMRDDAEQAAVEGVAGAAAAAMNLNFSGCALTNNLVTTNKCAAVSKCDQVASILQGGLAAGYVSAPDVDLTDIGSTNGSTAACKVTKAVGSKTYAANFAGVSAGN